MNLATMPAQPLWKNLSVRHCIDFAKPKQLFKKQDSDEECVRAVIFRECTVMFSTNGMVFKGLFSVFFHNADNGNFKVVQNSDSQYANTLYEATVLGKKDPAKIEALLEFLKQSTGINAWREQDLSSIAKIAFAEQPAEDENPNDFLFYCSINGRGGKTQTAWLSYVQLQNARAVCEQDTDITIIDLQPTRVNKPAIKDDLFF